MKKILLTVVAALLGGVVGVSELAAQGINNVRINEVLVVNQQNYEDDYGHNTPWIELFNSGYEAVNVASCYLGATKNGKETRYQIPSGDPATLMHSQTYLVFFCEGTDTKGTFYTNFTLDGVTKITLYTAGGTPISEFNLDPAAQVADVSVGWMSPDGTVPAKVTTLPRTTPGATNETSTGVAHDEIFRQRDSSGGVMAIIAMSVVFSALVLIFGVLKIFGATMIRLQTRKEAKPVEAAPTPKKKPAGEQVQEEMAAIALALRLSQEEQHIAESTVITINRASRVYSPWSSKIHGIRLTPNKR